MGAMIDEEMWERFYSKLPGLEAQRVLRELVDYVTDRLKSRIDEVKTWEGGVAFLSESREILTFNVTARGCASIFILQLARSLATKKNSWLKRSASGRLRIKRRLESIEL